MSLPRPEPSEVGLGDLVKCPQYASASLTGQVVITRLSADRLSVVYPFHVGTGFGDLGWGLSQKSWRIDAEIDLAKGEIAIWSLVEGCMPEGNYEFETVIRDCEIHIGNEELTIAGPGVSTTVWTKGQVRWLKSAGELSSVQGGRRTRRTRGITCPEE